MSSSLKCFWILIIASLIIKVIGLLTGISLQQSRYLIGHQFPFWIFSYLSSVHSAPSHSLRRSLHRIKMVAGYCNDFIVEFHRYLLFPAVFSILHPRNGINSIIAFGIHRNCIIVLVLSLFYQWNAVRDLDMFGAIINIALCCLVRSLRCLFGSDFALNVILCADWAVHIGISYMMRTSEFGCYLLSSILF